MIERDIHGPAPVFSYSVILNNVFLSKLVQIIFDCLIVGDSPSN